MDAAFLDYRGRLGPSAIIPVAHGLRYFADVDLRVEVRRKRMSVGPRVAVEDIQIIDFVEKMFLPIRGKDVRHAGIEAGAQNAP